MIRKYPKPVICGGFKENSLYKEDYDFKITIDEEAKRITSDSIELVFECQLNSSVLMKLIHDGKVASFYKVKTNLNSFMGAFEIDNGRGVCTIRKDSLERLDKIELSLYLVANEDFTLDDCSELIDEVKGYVFSFRKDELIGISNTEILNYSLSGKTFVNISLAESQEGKGLLFASADKQVIQIKVGPSWNDAYAKLKKKPLANDLLSPSLAFAAVLYALEKVIHSESNEGMEKDWYKIIDQNFESEKYDDLDDFIESMRQDYDVDAMFSVVQSVLNNSLETKVIRAAKRL